MFRHSIAETGLTKATCELSLSDFPLTTTVFFWYNNPMFCGGMAEWSNAAVLKTVVAQVTVGSNPTPTAMQNTLWRGARAVESGCLLSSCGASHHGFESHPLRHDDAPVAQWIRASDYGSEGRGFESSQALMSL